MKENVVILTGMGIISAAGVNLPETLDSLTNQWVNSKQVSLFETSLEYPVFEVNKIPEEFLLEGRRTISLALCAVDEALREAQLKDGLENLRVGVCLGTTVASQLHDFEFYKSYRDTGATSMVAVDRYIKGNLSKFVSKYIGAKGPSMTVANACSSGTDSIGIALSWIRNDLCDIAIAGGADELSRIPLCGFGSLGIVSPEPSAPFDKDRKGLSLGDGAGVLIIESKKSAERRGKYSNLFLAGYGTASDAYHLTTPRADGLGLELSIKKALSDSGVEPQTISFVNAHGTGTKENDRVEGAVLGRLFGENIKVYSIKGLIGHTLGAAGGIEAVLTVAGLRDGWIPATAGLKNPDQTIPVSPVMEHTPFDGHYAMSTSLAFGGNNAALVFGKNK